MHPELLDRLHKQFDFLTEQPALDCPAIRLPADRHRAFFEAFARDYDFDLLADLTAVDWEHDSPRFTVVYHFYTITRRMYLRVLVDCLSDSEPHMPTVSDLWPTADWHERECYDMFGIIFDQHPNLKRILMWDGYPYFPLRKEFPLAGHEVDLPAEDVAEATGAKVLPAPMMGGPFVASQTPIMSHSEPRAKDQSWTEKHHKPDNAND